jgi:glycosyltransferase involved in cell wall biosynthesis
MSEYKLSDLLTIVVPCKNEEDYIAHLLAHLHNQFIGSTRIIIADCSTDNTREIIQSMKGQLNVEIIDGGPVAVARNNGARIANTPYILFLDSDVRFFSNNVIRDCVKLIHTKELDLVGAKIKCYVTDIRAELGFSIFNLINGLLKYWSPFAVGAFMLTRTDKFKEYNGFDEGFIASEDFFLSKKYDPKKFTISNHYFGQDNRRFKKMGYFGMAWFLIKNFYYRNNKKYWQTVDHSNYWQSK